MTVNVQMSHKSVIIFAVNDKTASRLVLQRANTSAPFTAFVVT